MGGWQCGYERFEIWGSNPHEMSRVTSDVMRREKKERRELVGKVLVGAPGGVGGQGGRPDTEGDEYHVCYEVE
jgi:hypothetical protein